MLVQQLVLGDQKQAEWDIPHKSITKAKLGEDGQDWGKVEWVVYQDQQT